MPGKIRDRPGFRDVDAGGKRVGLHVNKHLRMLPTCRGTIHDGPDGAHIIPVRPPSSNPADDCPNKPHVALVDDVPWCCDRARPGRVSPALRALSFLFDGPARLLMLKAELDRAPGEHEREGLAQAESEIGSDLWHTARRCATRR